jgi:hypothetical protein
VQFEYGDFETLIPAGAEAITRPDSGTGTAYFIDASPEFKAALATFDTSQEGSDARAHALNLVLSMARPHDAMTLLNLLRKVERPQRERVLDVLSRFVPLPAGVTHRQVLDLQPDAMDRCWRGLGFGNPKSWIRHWPDVLIG